MMSQKVGIRDFPGSPVFRLRVPNAEGTGSISGPGTKIPSGTAKKEKKKTKPRKVGIIALILAIILVECMVLYTQLAVLILE